MALTTPRTPGPTPTPTLLRVLMTVRFTILATPSRSAIAKLHDGRYIHYLDIGDDFLEAEGTLPTDVMPDLLHPNEKGYQVWADAIREPLQALLK